MRRRGGKSEETHTEHTKVHGGHKGDSETIFTPRRYLDALAEYEISLYTYYEEESYGTYTS